MIRRTRYARNKIPRPTKRKIGKNKRDLSFFSVFFRSNNKKEKKEEEKTRLLGVNPAIALRTSPSFGIRFGPKKCSHLYLSEEARVGRQCRSRGAVRPKRAQLLLCPCVLPLLKFLPTAHFFFLPRKKNARWLELRTRDYRILCRLRARFDKKARLLSKNWLGGRSCEHATIELRMLWSQDLTKAHFCAKLAWWSELQTRDHWRYAAVMIDKSTLFSQNWLGGRSCEHETIGLRMLWSQDLTKAHFCAKLAWWSELQTRDHWRYAAVMIDKSTPLSQNWLGGRSCEHETIELRMLRSQDLTKAHFCAKLA